MLIGIPVLSLFILVAVVVFNLFMNTEQTVINDEVMEVEAEEMKSTTIKEKESEDVVALSITILQASSNVVVEREEEKIQATEEMQIFTGDRITTVDNSNVELAINEDEKILLGENSQIEILDISSTEDGMSVQIEQSFGSTYHQGNHRDGYELVVNDSAIKPLGTHFIVSIEPNTGMTSIFVASGIVQVGTPKEERPPSIVYPSQVVNVESNNQNNIPELVDPSNMAAIPDSEIIKQIIKNKADIDKENDMLLQILSDNHEIPALPKQLDMDVIPASLMHAFNQLFEQSILQGDMEKEELNDLINQANQRLLKENRFSSLLIQEDKLLQDLREQQKRQQEWVNDYQSEQEKVNREKNVIDQMERVLQEKAEQKQREEGQERLADERLKEALNKMKALRAEREREIEEQRQQEMKQVAHDRLAKEKLEIERLEREREEERQRAEQERLEEEERQRQEEVFNQKVSLIEQLINELPQSFDINLADGTENILLSDLIAIDEKIQLTVTTGHASVATAEIVEESLIISPREAGETTVHLAISFGSFETVIPFEVVVHSKPLHTVQDFEIKDTNPLRDAYNLSLSLTRAEDESNISHYTLYWADANMAIIADSFATLEKTGENLHYSLSDNSSIPETATGIVIFAKNDLGESDTYKYVEIQDYKNYSVAGELQDIEMFVNDERGLEIYHVFLDENGGDIYEALYEGDIQIKLQSEDEPLVHAYEDGGYYVRANDIDGTTTVHVRLTEGNSDVVLAEASFQVTVNQIELPPPPQNIYFESYSQDPYSTEGSLEIIGAADESNIDGYLLYWSNDNNEKLAHLGHVSPSEGTFELFHNVYPGATRIIAYSYSGEFESEEFAYVDLWNMNMDPVLE